MKYSIISKLLLRKIKKQLAIFLSTVFIVALAIAFFTAVKTVYIDFNASAESYFENNLLYDIVFFGMFSDDDVLDVEDVNSVARVEAKYRFEAKITDSSQDAIVYGVNNNKIRINRPHIYDGASELGENEIRINKNYASKNNLDIGDTLNIEINGETNKFSIASLASYPNYVFLYKDRASSVSDSKDFAVIEMNENFFKEKFIPYNTIYVRYKKDVDIYKAEHNIREELVGRSFAFSTRTQSLNYATYNQTVSQIDAFSYFMPIILLTMSGLLLYVVQRRNVAVERKQIGIMKALGLSDINILFMYIKYSIILVVLGIVVALGIVEAALPFIFVSLQNLFDLPLFNYSRHISLWLISSFIIFFVCSISNLLAASSLLKMNPAESMRGEIPRGGKKVFFESFKWWQKISFNTRYSIKTSLRGKTRYFASLWGMFAAVAMTVFAQGFNNSFDYFIYSLYNDFALYDVNVSIKDRDINEEPLFLLNNDYDTKNYVYDKASIYQARLSKAFASSLESSVDNPVLIYDNDSFSLLNIPNDTNRNNGVMISASLARRLGIKENDYIGVEIYMFGKSKYNRVQVNKIIDQSGMFFLYMDTEYAKEYFDAPSTYNTVYLKTDDKDLESLLESSDDVLSYSLKEVEEQSSRKQIATIFVLVQILIFVAFLLGAASLYGVGIVTLATRKYEFTLLKVMGYSTFEIMLAWIKESVSQVLISLPIGMLSGLGILHLVKDKFSSDFFDFIPKIYFESYIFATALLLVSIVLVSLISTRYIDKIDMVEGLKEREE